MNQNKKRHLWMRCREQLIVRLLVQAQIGQTRERRLDSRRKKPEGGKTVDARS